MIGADEKRAFHDWSKGTDPLCNHCGCPDMVAYCASHHEESCRCANPSCPPAPEDLQKAVELQQKILKAGKTRIGNVVTDGWLGNFKPNKNQKFAALYGGSGLAAHTGRFTSAYANTVPQFPMYGNHPDTKAPIEISRCTLFKDHATSTSSMTFDCQCGVHGSYQAKAQVIDTTIANSYQPDIWTIMLKQAFHCPKCDMEHKAAIVKAEEERDFYNDSYVIYVNELSTVTNVQAQIAEDLAKTVDSMIMKGVEPP
jgi:hypothetical protein